ncbi:hypothetical protein Pan216_08360 [Planctomycetes bacterium Pan216]|uniref:Uncharacterized protein n=1 Tax=Kolteria novifilia TaxID=2527975 RepID=A0A518AZ69_9BACT|nr:hypothetical protein Pan216_08360 [Planctomycetes bacterium Pan216]
MGTQLEKEQAKRIRELERRQARVITDIARLQRLLPSSIDHAYLPGGAAEASKTLGSVAPLPRPIPGGAGD